MSPAFVCSALKGGQSEGLVYVKASEGKHRLTVIFSPWSCEVACLLCHLLLL